MNVPRTGSIHNVTLLLISLIIHHIISYHQFADDTQLLFAMNVTDAGPALERLANCSTARRQHAAGCAKTEVTRRNNRLAPAIRLSRQRGRATTIHAPCVTCVPCSPTTWLRQQRAVSSVPCSTVHHLCDFRCTAASEEQPRVVCQREGRTDARPLLRSLHWLRVKHRVTFKMAALTFKTMFSSTPAKGGSMGGHRGHVPPPNPWYFF